MESLFDLDVLFHSKCARGNTFYNFTVYISLVCIYVYIYISSMYIAPIEPMAQMHIIYPHSQMLTKFRILTTKTLFYLL